MCWVDNMACDAATCKSNCLLAKLTRQPPVDKNGNLNAYVLVFFLQSFLLSTLPHLLTLNLKPAHSCLKCDEDFCGDPFIRCAPPPRAPNRVAVFV